MQQQDLPETPEFKWYNAADYRHKKYYIPLAIQVRTKCGRILII